VHRTEQDAVGNRDQQLKVGGPRLVEAVGVSELVWAYYPTNHTLAIAGLLAYATPEQKEASDAAIVADTKASVPMQVHADF